MNRHTVLIVDDEENVRNALKRSLRKEPYELLTAAGPEEGLQLLKSHRVDVVLSDHLMPKMTGLQFLTLVRDRHPDVARLMLTGHADLETAIRQVLGVEKLETSMIFSIVGTNSRTSSSSSISWRTEACN